MDRGCTACGFSGIPDVSPTSSEHHKAHRDQHLARFPQADKQTRDTLDRMVAFAERGAFSAPSPAPSPEAA
jgi:hypothetical protein